MFGLKNINPEHLMKMFSSMGIDVYAFAEKKIPELLKLALELEHRAGAQLMATLSISDDGTYFILCLYKRMAGGGLDLWQAFPLNDIRGIIDQIKNALKNADTSPEPVPALISGSIQREPGELDEYDWTAAASADHTAGPVYDGSSADTAAELEQQRPGDDRS